MTSQWYNVGRNFFFCCCVRWLVHFLRSRYIDRINHANRIFDFLFDFLIRAWRRHRIHRHTQNWCILFYRKHENEQRIFKMPACKIDRQRRRKIKSLLKLLFWKLNQFRNRLKVGVICLIGVFQWLLVSFFFLLIFCKLNVRFQLVFFGDVKWKCCRNTNVKMQTDWNEIAIHSFLLWGGVRVCVCLCFV